MDFLPVEFYENLVLYSSSDVFRQQDLSGTVGYCAKRFMEKGYRKFVDIKNGAIDVIDYYDFFYKWKQPESVVQASKFCLEKKVGFNQRQNPPSPIDEKLKKQLKKLCLEPGMLCLVLFSTKLNQAWIELFSSWRSLNSVCVADKFNKSVFTLLKKIMDQKQLLYLQFSLFSAIPSSKETDLICEFLKQPQFLELLFTGRFQEEVKSRVMSKWEENKEQFAGKMVQWNGFGKLHDDSFVCLERICAMIFQYRKENLVVEYWNTNAMYQTTHEEFMQNVAFSDLYFK
ncbi:hypothetical protein L596_017246 [Steinernema carpocapsae]|uniref:Uncharacterized protein n=1 Tax=Steinernema carpocapsae TaxID=34508 RepID=A0A4V6A1P2_STECR|nr:hypothetical protein L596_017246 [Steinernema carpocapsae]